MTLKQENVKVSNADLKGFERALELINAAEKYPSKDDMSQNLLEGDVGRALSRLGLEIETPIKAFDKDREKIAKKYEQYTTEKGEFKKGTTEHQEKYGKEIEKLLEKDEIRMLPLIPDPYTWEGFKCSFRVYQLLNKLFYDPSKKEKTE